MNNQRRHELEQNALAAYLARFVGKIQPIFKPAALVALVSLFGFVAYSSYTSLTSGRASSAWTKFYFNLNGDAESFQSLAEEIGNRPAGQWARYSAAIGFLKDGVEALYVNREEGVESIQTAIGELESLKGTSVQELQRQVWLALAQSYESLGELDQAIEHYEKFSQLSNVTDDEREQILDKISFLKSSRAVGFYQWFATLDPKPVAPPDISSDLSLPPDTPTINFDPAEMPDLPLIESPESAASIAEPPDPDLPQPQLDEPELSEPEVSDLDSVEPDSVEMDSPELPVNEPLSESLDIEQPDIELPDLELP